MDEAFAIVAKRYKGDVNRLFTDKKHMPRTRSLSSSAKIMLGLPSDL
ncbi:MAG: hypothetical protein HC841_09895 [Verrucomicrobiae bacterium]|nr:hypothetical protein [Verrucomicrobiae bacterium]